MKPPPHRRRGVAWTIAALALASHNLQDSAVAATPAPPSAASPGGSTPAPPLGRLFYTPDRRAALDRQRASNRPAERQVESRQLSFDGLVERSSGKRTVWVNGRPLTERDGAILGVAPRPAHPGRARITIPNEGSHDLAVGHSVNRDTGEVRSPLGGGQVRKAD